MPRPILPKPPGPFPYTPSSFEEPLQSMGEASRKRTPVSAACLACQTRHSKCDGGRPSCQICTAKSTNCEYEFNAGKTRNTARKELLSQAQADNSVLVEILSKLRSSSPQEAHQLLGFIRSADSISIYSVQAWIRNQTTALTAVPDSSSSNANAPVSNAPVAAAANTTQSFRQSFMPPHNEYHTPLLNAEAPAELSYKPLLDKWSGSATVAIIKHAIYTFLQCVETPFSVYSTFQIDQIILEAFGTVADDTVLDGSLKQGVDGCHEDRHAEVYAMAAIGQHFISLKDSNFAHMSSLAFYFYFLAADLFNTVIQADTLRAMKVCGLLAEYNKLTHGNMGLAYADFGIRLGYLSSIAANDAHLFGMDAETFVDYKRTMRYLSYFLE